MSNTGENIFTVVAGTLLIALVVSWCHRGNKIDDLEQVQNLMAEQHRKDSVLIEEKEKRIDELWERTIALGDSLPPDYPPRPDRIDTVEVYRPRDKRLDDLQETLDIVRNTVDEIQDDIRNLDYEKD